MGHPHLLPREPTWDSGDHVSQSERPGYGRGHLVVDAGLPWEDQVLGLAS